MIGTSLSYRSLVHDREGELAPDVLLPKLWAAGVRGVELRAVWSDTDPHEVLSVANLLWDYGFCVTVHSGCETAGNAVEKVFSPLALMLAHLRQRSLTVTLHPIAGDNVAMLRNLADHAKAKGYPVKIALENNRRMPDGTDGDSAALVLDAVKGAERDNVGICFDMGHYAWYAANFLDDPDALPPREFLRRVIHTHIHAYDEGTTHYPLRTWRAPYKNYIEALAFGYFGIYNLELEPPRFAKVMGATEGYLTSVSTLSAHMPYHAAFYDECRQTYDGAFRRALAVLEKKEGTFGTLLAPSAYLFSTHGYLWSVDLSFWHLRHLAEEPHRVRERLGGMDLMLLTHAHEDHMEEATLRALSDTEIRFVAPESLLPHLYRFGIRRSQITAVKAGDEIAEGPLCIRVLQGRHFRPDGSGIDAVGYLVRAENAPSIAFPGDVRDYRTEGVEDLAADHCFAHVWLTDEALLPECYLPACEDFARFMLKASQKSIFLTHLYSHRTEDKLWKLHHARAAAECIRALSPKTAVHIPRYGEIFRL